MPDDALVDELRAAVDTDRLIDTAVRLIEVPSPTCSAGDAADRLAQILTDDGFEVERPVADWPQAPAVVARLSADRPGPTLQFDGHLDTVHLPFVPPRVEDGILRGSGASDMKGGLAAACEAMRICRQTNALTAGRILFTAHDHHEAPWGDGRQLFALIEGGYVGDAALIPEYLFDRLPVMGRGMAILEVALRREGEPMHEVVGGLDQPSVIAAGAELIDRLMQLDRELAALPPQLGDRESVFIGQVAAGEIYNQSPTEFKLSGTRRWLPGTDFAAVEQQFNDVLGRIRQRAGITVDANFMLLSDTFSLDQTTDLVRAFQQAATAVIGKPLPAGTKPFLDDGNRFFRRAHIPAITHGPNATGAHTIDERAPVGELERVALLYALTAARFCGGQFD